MIHNDTSDNDVTLGLLQCNIAPDIAPETLTYDRKHVLSNAILIELEDRQLILGLSESLAVAKKCEDSCYVALLDSNKLAIGDTAHSHHVVEVQLSLAEGLHNRYLLLVEHVSLLLWLKACSQEGQQRTHDNHHHNRVDDDI